MHRLLDFQIGDREHVVANGQASSKTRYIELTSESRDRTRYPNPSQFVVELSLGGESCRSVNSKDPTFYSVTKYPPPNLNSTEFYNNYWYMYGTQTNGSNAAVENVIGVLPNTYIEKGLLNDNSINNFSGAYVDDVLELITYTDTGVATAEHEYRTITGYTQNGYEYISTVAVVDGTHPLTQTSFCINSTDIKCDIDFMFANWYFELTDTSDSILVGTNRKILYYRAYDQRIFFSEPIDRMMSDGDQLNLYIEKYQIQINSPFSVSPLPSIENILEQDNSVTYRIRSSQPINTGTLVSGTSSTFVLPASIGTTDITGNMIWITSNPVVLSGELDSASFESDGTFQTRGTFTLTTAGAFIDDFFKDMLIVMTSGNFAGFRYIITNWDQATQTGTVTPGWTEVIAGTTSPAGGDTFDIIQLNPNNYRLIKEYNTTTRTGTVNRPFSYTNTISNNNVYAVGSTDTYDILQFSIDNYHALDFSESIIAQQGGMCNDITLISLAIPNRTIKTGYGGTILDYPYVYVEFRGIQNSSGMIYALDSNNKNISKNMLFIASVINVYRLGTKFAVLDGNGMVQDVKFSMNDAFLFSVYLPNGELLIFDENDSVSPSTPNPMLQITAVFGVRRVVSCSNCLTRCS